jgi:hypothetical protein
MYILMNQDSLWLKNNTKSHHTLTTDITVVSMFINDDFWYYFSATVSLGSSVYTFCRSIIAVAFLYPFCYLAAKVGII